MPGSRCNVIGTRYKRAGVRHLLTEDLQDGFELAGVRFVNPFEAANNRLIDEVPAPG
jgi:predicted nucleic acid-binding protein